jgi:hypothetical protein
MLIIVATFATVPHETPSSVVLYGVITTADRLVQIRRSLTLTPLVSRFDEDTLCDAA